MPGPVLKVGVVGCGTMGGGIGRAADQGLVRVRPVGVGDSDPARAARLVRSLGQPAPVRALRDLLEAEGEFGKLFVRMENVPSPTNPRTSHLAALSAIALLRRITASLVAGT